MVHIGRIIAILTALLLAGCQKPAVVPASTVTSATNRQLPYLDHAQPRLTTIKLWVGPKELETELALTETQIYTGMMWRKEMGENEGMLFVFGGPHRVGFYMKNTTVPLSAGYIDPEGVLQEIHDLEPLNETPVEAASGRIQYVLETPRDWFKKNNIAPGTLIRTDRGTLEEVFMRRKQQ